MNYHNSSELLGQILECGDNVSLCDVGHKVNNCSLENLGGCHDSWIFEIIDTYEIKEFCYGLCGYEVKIPSSLDFPKFNEGDFISLTKIVITIMKKGEDEGYW